MTPTHFKAAIFDLDGVITDTAAVHSQAWKQMFDEYLRARSEKTGSPFIEFSHESDYLPYVDGKPRYQGVASFLESRQIHLPFGDPEDPPDLNTVCGLGNRKNQLFNQMIAGGNVTVFPSSVILIQQLKQAGIHLGVASSSKNCAAVLKAVGLLEFFETRVDGLVSAELGLKGKPQADIFTTACRNLGVPNHLAVVVEDAVSGVQAGRNGEFGLVLGIAREGNAAELKQNGADLVVTDLAKIDIPQIDAWFQTHQD
jgi:beta-phosphoglucomutase family hydrolase